MPFYNSSITFPDTLDDYTYACFEYNAGNPNTGNTTDYSAYLEYDFIFRRSDSSNIRYYYDIGDYNKAGGTGTRKFEISSSTKSSYNTYMSRVDAGTYLKVELAIGGWDDWYEREWDDEDDDYYVYYNYGYITAFWLE